MNEVDEFIAIIDGRMEKGVSRLKVFGTEELHRGEVTEEYHHGRCDVGSPFACGTIPNFDSIDGDEGK